MNQFHVFSGGRTLRMRLLAFLCTVFLLAACGSGNATEETDPAEDAYVMGEPITDSTYAIIIESEYGGDQLTTAEYQKRLQNFIQQVPAVAQDPTQLEQLHRGIAEEFIQRHLLGGEARERGLTIDTALVAEQIAVIRSNFETQEEFETLLASRGLTMDSLRTSIAEQLLLQQMQEEMIAGATEPTPAELDAFREEQAEQVRAQHILFRVLDPARKDSVIEQANAVLDSVKAGADFATMAARYGTDGTRTQGGDLGYFSKSEMVEPFSEAAFALADSGDVASKLVETQFGYHIIRLTGRRTAELMDTTRAQAMMMQERQREAFEAAFDAIKQKAVVRVNPNVVKTDLKKLDG